jgi:hypothetical protein
MPDFDDFERIFKSAVMGEISASVGAKKISDLEDKNRVLIVKGKTLKEIDAFLVRANSALLGFFSTGANFTSNDDNRNGKDLFETSTNTHVELKSGKAKTEANSGLEIVSWATGDINNELALIMNQGMLERRGLALAKRPQAEIDASKSQSMDKLADHLDKIVKIGPATDHLAHFFKMVGAGVTNGDNIIESFGKGNAVTTPLLLEATWESGLKLYSKAFLPSEELIVTRIERTNKRIQLLVEGVDSKRRGRLYPNFKNSWTSPDHQKVPARNWVKSPCFQIWLK